MRADIVTMIAEAGSGHPGGSLSAADIVAALYFGVMRHKPDNPGWRERDRFILSKGHAGPVLYVALAEAGYFGREHLSTLRKLGSILQGHPDSRKTPGVEVSTGSLGQGLSIANGIALALLSDGYTEQRVWCLLGDGELQEGQVWEAAMFAAHHGLYNVVAIIDHNGLQIDGACSDVMDLGEVAQKFAAFGWTTSVIDGHDVEVLLREFDSAREGLKAPRAIICRTVKGKGVSFMENDPDWHGKATTAEETICALGDLGCELTKGGR